MVDDRTLVQRCRRGEALAWEALVRRYQGRVYSVAWHYLRNAEEARDAAQDVFIRVWGRLDQFHGGERFLPWLLSLARNACIDRLRRGRARAADASVPLEDAPPLVTELPDAERQAESDSCRRLVHRALDGLSEKNREMILLKEIQGLKLEEIADLLALPLGTVKSRSNRARLELAREVRRLDPSFGA